MIPKAIVAQRLKEVVKAAETVVLPQLQLIDPAIVNVNYIFGNLEDIRIRLREMSGTPEEADMRYPCVILLTDIRTTTSKGKYAGDVQLQMAIMYPTERQAKPDERYDNVITPVLIPVYTAFLEAIVDSGLFVLTSTRQIDHKCVEVLHQSITKLADGTYDIVDALELSDLKLTINNENTFLKPINESIEGI